MQHEDEDAGQGGVNEHREAEGDGDPGLTLRYQHECKRQKRTETYCIFVGERFPHCGLEAGDGVRGSRVITGVTNALTVNAVAQNYSQQTYMNRP